MQCRFRRRPTCEVEAQLPNQRLHGCDSGCITFRITVHSWNYVYVALRAYELPTHISIMRDPCYKNHLKSGESGPSLSFSVGMSLALTVPRPCLLSRRLLSTIMYAPNAAVSTKPTPP